MLLFTIILRKKYIFYSRYINYSKEVSDVKKLLFSIIFFNIFSIFSTYNINLVRAEEPNLTFSTANSTESDKKICENCAEQIKNLQEQNSVLLSENEKLKHDKYKYKNRAQKYKQELELKQNYVSPETLKVEFYRAKSELLTELLLELNKNQENKNFDANGLFSKFINFDINYTNNGHTEVAPAKATVAGANFGI